MSTKPKPGRDDESSPEVKAAEPVVWATYQRDLEQQGQGEHALYLQHLMKAKVKEVKTAGDYKHVCFELHQRLSEYTSTYNAENNEQMSWFFHALMEDPGRAMDPQKGTMVGEAVAQPPDDAVLEVAEYQDQGGQPVFVARWAHQLNGIPVERDYIQTLINGNTEKVFALHRKWHDVNQKASAR